jgi:translation initiation factor IF-2
MGVRVYELARTLELSSKELMHELKKQGIDVKSHMSSIDDETADLIVDLLKTSPTPTGKGEPPAAPAVEQPPEVSVIEPPTPFTPEVVAPSPTSPTPEMPPEPTPVVAVEPPKAAATVEAPPAVKAPPERRLR